MRYAFTLLATLALVLAGCSGEDERVWNESDVADHIGLTENASGSPVWVSPHGTECYLPVVMTTAQQVSMYASAGDTVATNPSETAGVKIVGGETAFCLSALTKALEDLD